jgi:hypothetical protein
LCAERKRSRNERYFVLFPSVCDDESDVVGTKTNGSIELRGFGARIQVASGGGARAFEKFVPLFRLGRNEECFIYFREAFVIDQHGGAQSAV